MPAELGEVVVLRQPSPPMCGSARHRMLQQIKCPVGLSQEGIDTGDVVVDRMIVGLKRERALCKSHCTLPISQYRQGFRDEKHGAGALGMPLEFPLGSLQRDLRSADRLFGPTQSVLDPGQHTWRMHVIGAVFRGLVE